MDNPFNHQFVLWQDFVQFSSFHQLLLDDFKAALFDFMRQHLLKVNCLHAKHFLPIYIFYFIACRYFIVTPAQGYPKP